MYQMNAGRAEAGLEDDGEDLRLRAAESGGRPAVDDVGEELRDVGRAGAEDVGKRRILVRGEHERAQGRRQVLGWASAEVLELRLDAVAHPPRRWAAAGRRKASASIKAASRRLISRRITYQRSPGAMRSSRGARIGMVGAVLEARPRGG